MPVRYSFYSHLHQTIKLESIIPFSHQQLAFFLDYMVSHPTMTHTLNGAVMV